jgi:uncharacterized OB-fold protein
MGADAAHAIASRGADAGFWTGLQAGRFRMPRCSRCARWIWPADWRCAACGSFRLDWIDVAPHGFVYSWTRTWYPFVAERADDLPYVVVLVELPEAGRSRLLGTLTGDQTNLAVGAAVTGQIRAPDERTFGLPSMTWSLVADSTAR